MKKSIILAFAALMVAFMAGCGGGSSSASSHAAPASTSTEPAAEVAFDVAPDTSDPIAQYKTTASGDFPPAPPSSELAAAQAAADARLVNN